MKQHTRKHTDGAIRWQEVSRVGRRVILSPSSIPVTHEVVCAWAVMRLTFTASCNWRYLCVCAHSSVSSSGECGRHLEAEKRRQLEKETYINGGRHMLSTNVVANVSFHPRLVTSPQPLFSLIFLQSLLSAQTCSAR